MMLFDCWQTRGLYQNTLSNLNSDTAYITKSNICIGKNPTFREKNFYTTASQ
jgi:hypothetical protein